MRRVTPCTALCSGDLPPARVRQERGQSWKSPLAPSPDEQEVFIRGVGLLFPTPSRQIKSWVREACNFRRAFQGTIIAQGVLGVGGEAFVFMFATKSPMKVMLFPVKLAAPPPASPSATIGDILEADVASFEFEF